MPWGHPESEYSNQPSGPCNSFARGKTGLCPFHSGLVQDKRVHGDATPGPIVQDLKLSKSGKMKEIITAEDMNVDIMKIESGIEASGRQNLFCCKIIFFCQSLDSQVQKALECPCVAELRNGACGVQFTEAFLCFLKSTAEEKGSDCVHSFVALQNCIKGNPEAFPKNIVEEKVVKK
ncbi:hypothetical protein CRYUN_Cryun18bG0071400 [Craigia yunnanensis]